MALSDTFEGKLDIHKSITVDSSLEPCEDLNLFTKKLDASLQKWMAEKIRGVWFNVAITHVTWIPILAQNGFRVHHGKGDMISLCRWLPRDEQNRIPEFAHTMVGAGGVVVNNKNQVLVVCERYRNQPYWKLPGGYVEPGEEIVDAVKREVLEETNVQTEYVSLVAFRHTKQAAFGCSDFYFIVELKPLSEDVIRQEQEIDAVQWMNIDEFMTHPLVHENNRFFLQKYLEGKEKEIMIQRETTFHPITRKPQSLFSVAKRI